MTEHCRTTDVASRVQGLLSRLKGLSAVSGLALAMAFAGQGEALASTQVSAGRLAEMSRGINADNIVNNNTYYADYGPDDMAKLKAMGITYVRLPIDPSWIIPSAPIDGKKDWSDAARAAVGVARLDAAVSQFVNAGLPVMLVIQPQPKLRGMKADQQEKVISRAVGFIAKRYAPLYTPDEVFFETLNEPLFDPTEWNSFLAQLVTLIRVSAPRHTIVVPPIRADNPDFFPNLTPLADQNVVYTMHVYQPIGITHQGAGVMPQPYYRFPRPDSSNNVLEWTNDQLGAFLHEGIDWAVANDVPLIINEFGATSKADPASRMKWIAYVRQTAEANHVGWAWWSFSGRLFGLRPHAGTGWDANLTDALSTPPAP